MDRNREKPKRKKTSIILRIALVLFSIYAIYNIFRINVTLRDRQTQIDELTSSIYQLQVQNQELEETLESELTDDEIANIARQKLGYAYYGEKIYINITGK